MSGLHPGSTLEAPWVRQNPCDGSPEFLLVKASGLIVIIYNLPIRKKNQDYGMCSTLKLGLKEL
jgi:hypothetical protein